VLVVRLSCLKSRENWSPLLEPAAPGLNHQGASDSSKEKKPLSVAFCTQETRDLGVLIAFGKIQCRSSIIHRNLSAQIAEGIGDRYLPAFFYSKFLCSARHTFRAMA
jgi:hypothetical protein